jgi:hypothetical protein
VLDIGERYVHQAENPVRGEQEGEAGRRGQDPDSFVSKEDYFPILETNAKDLQLLEALVVRYITEFYTYMKATRDSLRKLATTKPSVRELAGEVTPAEVNMSSWSAAYEDVIYMLFLGYESGRKAVEDLIEYQPSRAENRIVILLTELQCYSFLIKRFKSEEVHHARLLLRETAYKQQVPELCMSVFASDRLNDPAWEAARKTAPELAKRYNRAFNETLILPSGSRQVHL